MICFSVDCIYLSIDRKTIMILHLQNVHFASDPVINKFETAFPNKNIAIRLQGFDNPVSVIKDGSINHFANAREAAESIDFSIISIVVVYHLDFEKDLFILKYIPQNIPIVWWMYGWDLYLRLWHKGYELYAPQTLPFVSDGEKGIVLRAKLFLELKYKQYIDKKVQKRIIGVIPCEKPDYNLACLVLGRSVTHVDIYGRSLLHGLPFSTGNDICIGHSASLSGNHLYALDILKKVDICDSNVFLPLSYSVQSESYKTAVVEKYKQHFGEKAQFLFDYQDVDTYRRGFLRYKVAIYPTWRQEALGNIFICFQLGIKVFLSRHNPCLVFFLSQGLFVYALEDIKSVEDLNPLTQEQKEKNLLIYKGIKEERDRVFPENLNRFFARYTE